MNKAFIYCITLAIASASYNVLAAPVLSLSTALSLSATIASTATPKVSLRSEIVDGDFRVLVYDDANSRFKPIRYHLRSFSPNQIAEYEVAIVSRSLNCVDSSSSTTVTPTLSEQTFSVSESSNKLVFNGFSKYWTAVNTGVSGSSFNDYYSDLNITVSFPQITKATEQKNCTGSVTVITSVNLTV